MSAPVPVTELDIRVPTLVTHEDHDDAESVTEVAA
jgi:hypothetical protein